MGRVPKQTEAEADEEGPAETMDGEKPLSRKLQLYRDMPRLVQPPKYWTPSWEVVIPFVGLGVVFGIVFVEIRGWE